MKNISLDDIIVSILIGILIVVVGAFLYLVFDNISIPKYCNKNNVCVTLTPDTSQDNKFCNGSACIVISTKDGNNDR